MNEPLAAIPDTPPSRDPTASDLPAIGADLPPFWSRLEQMLDRLGDMLNPILVKETRQALKSRQFTITFSLLLLLGWVWTALFVVITIPTVYYVPLGPYVLGGYCLILTIPMLIVVPFASFRSLADELEDGTYEMLSITTLGSRQIVLGKLGSSVVQMLVYYSALAPCVAFTYLLRGLDLLTILHVLGYTFLGSLLLSVVGLMLATVTRSRHWQMVLSVLFIILLLVGSFVGNSILISVLSAPSAMLYDRWEFWGTEFVVLSFYCAYLALFLQIAAGEISFASENRSTPIRKILFGIQLLIVGWCLYFAISLEMPLLILVIFSALHWISAGIFLTGERSKLSPRALRSLPQTLLGRMFLTWFNPGSATGYVFAMTCLLTNLLVVLAYVVIAPLFITIHDTLDVDLLHPTLAIVGYVCFYLGFSRLLVLGFVRLGTRSSMMLQALVQIMVAFLGCLLPALLQVALEEFDFSRVEYSPMQIPNWMWTLSESFDGGLDTGLFSIPVIVFLIGLTMYVFHIYLAAGETEKQRLAAPQRVREEDAALGRDRRPAMIEF